MTAISELEGFTVYHPTLEARGAVFLSSNEAVLRLSRPAMALLGDPAHVLIFFDEKKKRLMVAAAKPEVENVIVLSGKGRGCRGDRINCCIALAGANKMVRKLAGCKDMKTTYRFPGHVIEGVEGKIIFELSRAVPVKSA